MKNITDLIGRILLGLIFTYEAYDSIFYFKETKQTMTDYGIVWQQEALLLGAITFLVLGSLSIITGYRAKLGAWLILLYWLPVTFIVHDYWTFPKDEQRIQAILFMKNLAIAGGLLILISNGSGRYSVKRLFARASVG